MSSVYSLHGDSYSAERCMDGEQFGDDSICQTGKGPAPWIAFDLGEEMKVGSVVIFIGDDTREALNFDVRMTPALPKDGENKFSGGTSLGDFNGTRGQCQRILIKSPTPQSGRYVFIQKNPDGAEGYLSFQEVLIFEPSQDLPGVYKLE